jgi:1,4-dihydroxy-2-naphthoyl-CoA synthase
MPVTYATHDDIAVLTLDNPPVNGLGHSTRAGIVEGIGRANDDASVTGIVIIGAGKAFSGGADITEFNTPKATQEPTLPSVVKVVEESAKPVVAAIHAIAMGGGLELALGAHYRVASPGAQIALPEVKLGLLPGAGGTQRLPRVVGLEKALDMIVTGSHKPRYSMTLPKAICSIPPSRSPEKSQRRKSIRKHATARSKLRTPTASSSKPARKSPIRPGISPRRTSASMPSKKA